MKWLWNWLFPKPNNLVRPFGGVWAGLETVVTEYRPDLLPEFQTFRFRNPVEMGRWLDKHFPRDDERWGLTSVIEAPANLRRYVQSRQPSAG